MTIDRSRALERTLPGLFVELAQERTPDYLEAAIERASSRPQRPAWTFPERWIPVELVTSRVPVTRLPWRQIGALALIALLLAAILAAYAGSQTQHLPAPFGPAANGDIPYVSGGDIYVGDPVSGATRLVLGGPEEDFGPDYSADGTWIAFLRKAAIADVDLYVIRPDGSDLRRLTSESISGEAWVNWSPDSRHLAIIRQIELANGGCGVTICFTKQLDLIDLSGEMQTIATAEGMDSVQFRPPDARELLYRARLDGKWGLFAMDADGKNARPLAQPDVPGEMDLSFANATYSSDGTRIFYQHGDAGGCCRLWVMNADGTNAHEFRAAGPAWDGVPIPSPDGTWIAYWHNADVGPDHGISVVRADGTGGLVETGPPLPAGAVWVWAPDSSKILMYPNDGSQQPAYLLDPAGGPWTRGPWASDADLDWQRIAK